MRVAFPIAVGLIAGALVGFTFSNYMAGAAVGVGLGAAFAVAARRKPPPPINPD